MVSCFPANWLYKSKHGETYTYWPTNKISLKNIRNLMMRKQQPTEDWELHPITLKGAYATYEAARKKEILLEKYSSSETEQQDLGRGKRKKVKTVQSSDESENEGSIEKIVIPSKKVYKKVPLSSSALATKKNVKTNEENNEDSEDNIEESESYIQWKQIHLVNKPFSRTPLKTLKDTENTQHDIAQGTNTINEVDLSMILEANESPPRSPVQQKDNSLRSSDPVDKSNRAFNMEPLLPEKPAEDDSNESTYVEEFEESNNNLEHEGQSFDAYGEFSQSGQDIDTDVTNASKDRVSDCRLLKEILTIKNYTMKNSRMLEQLKLQMQHFATNTTIGPANAQFINEIIPLLPMDSWESVETIESKLKSRALQLQMIEFLMKLGGLDQKDFIRRCYKKIFSSTIEKECSYTGAKNNRPINRLILVTLMKESAYKLFKTSEKSFDDESMEWLRTAKQRAKHKQKE